MNINCIKQCIRYVSILLAVETAGTAMISLWLGYHVSRAFAVSTAPIGALWCAISAVIILNLEEKNTLIAAFLRFVGTLVATALSIGLVNAFGYSLTGFTLCAFLSVMICSVLKAREGFRHAVVTLIVLYMIGRITPNIAIEWNALGRLAESTTGIIIGLLVTLIFYPVRGWLRSKN